jgi:class 3 adenylate cyclase
MTPGDKGTRRVAPALRKRLTAILAVDVAGYSRLIGENEPATVAATGEYHDIVSGISRPMVDVLSTRPVYR